MSIIPFERSFASSEKSQYWSAKNGDIKPREISKSSHTKYWFDCIKCNHQFDTSLANLNHGNWCPYCSNQKLCKDNNCVICYEKSFASQEKSKYWSNKNGDINQRQIFKSSSIKKYWFDCIKCNHSFDASTGNIIKGKWCPYCSNQKLCKDNNCVICYEKSFASHPKALYWNNEKSGTISPRDVLKSSNNNYWFDCNNCNHTFDKVLGSVNGGTWCPYCSSPPKLLCNDNECSLCFDKSFASHEKSKYWSNKNGDIKPREIFKSSNTKYWFDCYCNHTFDKVLGFVNRGSWCPYCSSPPKLLCNDNECSLCFDKSFASHEKSKYWSNKNGDIKPREIFRWSHNKYWFDCNNCNHTFDTLLSNINYGQWCPYCSNRKLCDKECKICFEKSFAFHPNSVYWNNEKNGAIVPREIFRWSNNKYWFDCNKCNHTFDTSLCHLNDGNWCPFCKNKTEGKLYSKLLPIYPTIITQFKQEWCKKIHHLPFDFCIPEYKIIIELDGPQHFRQVSNWSSPEEQFENDKYKEKYANDNDYSIIRILQEDVLNDRYDWLTELCKYIEEIKNGDEIANVYLCKNGEYDAFCI